MPRHFSRFSPGLFIAISTIGAATVSSAQDGRPVFSDPYEVADVVAALVEVKARHEQTQADLFEAYSQFEGKLEDFERTDPILQQVTWSYETCTDLHSLFPPPLEGWGVRSDAPWTTLPVDDMRGEIYFVTFDPLLDQKTAEMSEKSVYIQITANAATVEAHKMGLSNEILRDIKFEPGPYNYPVLRHVGGTLLGDYLVSISGSDPEVESAYLAEMISCAIQNDLIAEGIDPATLRDEP